MPHADRLRSWADLVFHVLAHVPSRSRVAASVYDPTYVRFVEQHIGPANRRELGTDISVLASLLPTHDSLVSAQMLAWLFRSTDRALAQAQCELGQLRPTQVDHPALLKRILLHPASELLWASALLEADSFSRLPPIDLDPRGIDDELDSHASIAPMLRQCQVAFVRSLRLRGRVWGQEIWVGVPSDDYCLSPEHVVWQACHEAVVLEVSSQASWMGMQLTHAQTEHAALVTLYQRTRSRFQSPHARWLSHLGQYRPAVESNRLSPPVARLVDMLLRGPDQ